MNISRMAMFGALLPALILAGCATQSPETVIASAPGFFSGVWHGFIAPISMIGHLFDSSIAIYSVPNNGGWYAFGWIVGVVLSSLGCNEGRKQVIQPRYLDPIYRNDHDSKS